VVKLLLLAMLAGAFANGLASRSEPPLLIDSSAAPATLDPDG
jgi:hypothetical protein